MGKKQRLDKILANLGYGSRSEIKKMVRQGLVQVEGETVADSGLQVDPLSEQITVGSENVLYRDFIYLMLHKPGGVISATDDLRDRTVLDLLDPDDLVFTPFPVGRLDKDTEGLLVLTNDGKLAHELLSPRKHVPKTYYAEIEGAVKDADVSAFAIGVELDDGYVTKPAKLNILDVKGETSRVEVTITEGKYHQVKRMFAAVHKHVSYLKRISMGGLLLDPDLLPGKYRELTEEEVDILRKGRDAVQE